MTQTGYASGRGNSKNTAREPDVPRVKREGEPNYALDQGKRMETLINRNGQPMSTRPQPRVSVGLVHAIYLV